MPGSSKSRRRPRKRGKSTSTNRGKSTSTNRGKSTSTNRARSKGKKNQGSTNKGTNAQLVAMTAMRDELQSHYDAVKALLDSSMKEIEIKDRIIDELGTFNISKGKQDEKAMKESRARVIQLKSEVEQLKREIEKKSNPDLNKLTEMESENKKLLLEIDQARIEQDKYKKLKEENENLLKQYEVLQGNLEIIIKGDDAAKKELAVKLMDQVNTTTEELVEKNAMAERFMKDFEIEKSRAEQIAHENKKYINTINDIIEISVPREEYREEYEGIVQNMKSLKAYFEYALNENKLDERHRQFIFDALKWETDSFEAFNRDKLHERSEHLFKDKQLILQESNGDKEILEKVLEYHELCKLQTAFFQANFNMDICLIKVNMEYASPLGLSETKALGNKDDKPLSDIDMSEENIDFRSGTSSGKNGDINLTEETPSTSTNCFTKTGRMHKVNSGSNDVEMKDETSGPVAFDDGMINSGVTGGDISMNEHYGHHTTSGDNSKSGNHGSGDVFSTGPVTTPTGFSSSDHVVDGNFSTPGHHVTFEEFSTGPAFTSTGLIPSDHVVDGNFSTSEHNISFGDQTNAGGSHYD